MQNGNLLIKSKGDFLLWLFGQKKIRRQSRFFHWECRVYDHLEHFYLGSRRIFHAILEDKWDLPQKKKFEKSQKWQVELMIELFPGPRWDSWVMATSSPPQRSPNTFNFGFSISTGEKIKKNCMKQRSPRIESLRRLKDAMSLHRQPLTFETVLKRSQDVKSLPCPDLTLSIRHHPSSTSRTCWS